MAAARDPGHLGAGGRLAQRLGPRQKVWMRMPPLAARRAAFSVTSRSPGSIPPPRPKGKVGKPSVINRLTFCAPGRVALAAPSRARSSFTASRRPAAMSVPPSEPRARTRKRADRTAWRSNVSGCTTSALVSPAPFADW